MIFMPLVIIILIILFAVELHHLRWIEASWNAPNVSQQLGFYLDSKKAVYQVCFSFHKKESKTIA